MVLRYIKVYVFVCAYTHAPLFTQLLLEEKSPFKNVEQLLMEEKQRIE